MVDKIISLTFALLIMLAAGRVFAAPPAGMPYFASIRSNEANVRTGPSVKYPIQWVYKRKNWPVEVTATFEGWRKISDINGEAGWIHESLLTRKRNVMINTEGVQEVYRLPVLTATVMMLVENGVIAELLQCKADWCKIQVDDIKGWVRSEFLWGVHKEEVLGG